MIITKAFYFQNNKSNIKFLNKRQEPNNPFRLDENNKYYQMHLQ